MLIRTAEKRPKAGYDKPLIDGIFRNFNSEHTDVKVEMSELLDFYKKIILEDKPDVIICMSRKAWCVTCLFLPILREEGIDVDRIIITHDRMVHPVLTQMTPAERAKLKVFVIDDTFQTGRAIDDCIRRLNYVYGVSDITVAVFAMAQDNHEYNKNRFIPDENHPDKTRYIVYKSPSRPELGSFPVNWGGRDKQYSREEVSLFSNYFIETFHACGLPYVGYIPAFRIPLDKVEEFLGATRGKKISFKNMPEISVPGFLEQSDLRPPLSDPMVIGYYNITNPQMRKNDVEAFYFTLPASESGNSGFLPPFLPTKNALSVAALRFYLNHKTGRALVVPYISLKDCYADAKIIDWFPPKLRPLLDGKENGITTPAEEWEDWEQHLCAYRILRYASGYLWGKYIIKKWFDIDVTDEHIASNGGIRSKEFFAWLDSPDAVWDMEKIWPFFDPDKGNVVKEEKETQSPTELKACLKEIISRSLRKEDVENFSDAICDQLLAASDPFDFFGTAGMLFRSILDRELELLGDNVKENIENRTLPPPFHGFPLQGFFDLLLKMFPEQLENRKDVFTTVTLMLCDSGIAVTQLQQRPGVYCGKPRDIIGTVLINGEQSCHALAPIAPAYSIFLTEFTKILRDTPEDKRREKFDRAKEKVRAYFKEEIEKGEGRRLSLEELMTPFNHIYKVGIENCERDYYAYSAFPRSFFFDCSERFFIELRDNLKA